MTTTYIWEKPSLVPLLSASDVHVWKIPLGEEEAQQSLPLLSHAEQQRLARMPEIPRQRFACARAALRNILAIYLEYHPQEVAFAAGEHGKLFLPGHPLYFNLSHAGNLALLAVCRHAEVGVDIEKVDDRRAIDGIASRFFSPAEQVALSQYEGGAYIRAFFRCWSRKEAVIKALGEGLACPLGQFDVSLHPEKATLIAFRRESIRVQEWFMAHLHVHQDYEAALAVTKESTGWRGYEYDINNTLAARTTR